MAVASTDICLTRLDEEVEKGQAIPAAARWFVEQQSSELPFCQPQQERAGQRQRQYRVSGRVRSPVKCSSVRELTNRNSFVGSVKEEFRPVPVVLVTASENQIGLGSLVGVKAEELPNFSN